MEILQEWHEQPPDGCGLPDFLPISPHLFRERSTTGVSFDPARIECQCILTADTARTRSLLDSAARVSNLCFRCPADGHRHNPSSTPSTLALQTVSASQV